MIKTMLLVTPSAVIRGFISEIKFLGRKNTLSLGFFGAFINAIICFIISSYIPFFSGLLKFSIHISSGTVSIYTSEVYPTEVRSLAVGFGTSVTRIAAFLSSFATEIFDSLTPKGSFILFAITSFISFLCSINLKYETLGKPLDFDTEETDNITVLSSNEENENITLNNNKNPEQLFTNKNKSISEVIDNTSIFGKSTNISDSNENLKSIFI